MNTKARGRTVAPVQLAMMRELVAPIADKLQMTPAAREALTAITLGVSCVIGQQVLEATEDARRDDMPMPATIHALALAHAAAVAVGAGCAMGSMGNADAMGAAFARAVAMPGNSPAVMGAKVS